MAFPVILQTNMSEENRLDKNLQDIATLQGTLKQETSILSPTIIIEGNPSSLAICNYMTISSFGRRYFVTDIRAYMGGMVEVSGRVDVLTSYAAQIRQCTGIVHRQESIWNLYLDDGSFKVYQNPIIVQKNFPQGFNTLQFVLAVAGKP